MTAPLARQLRSKAAALRAQADDLDALAESVEETPKENAALDLGALRARYGFTRESLRSAQKNGLKVHKGPRGKVMAFEGDVVAWIRERDWKPVAKGKPVDSLEDVNAATAKLLGVG